MLQVEVWTNMWPSLGGDPNLKKNDKIKQQLIKEQMGWWPSSGGV